MAEADNMYRKYISQIEGEKNDFNLFKSVDKIGLVNSADEDDGLGAGPMNMV